MKTEAKKGDSTQGLIGPDYSALKKEGDKQPDFNNEKILGFSEQSLSPFEDKYLEKRGDSMRGPIRFVSSTPTLPSYVLRGGLPVLEPEDGAVWYEKETNSEIHFIGGKSVKLGGIISTITSDVTVANTLTETTISSLVLDADTMAVGRSYKFTIWGFYSCLAGSGIYIRIKNGATFFAAAGLIALGATTDNGLHMEVIVTCRSTGVTGTVQTQGDVIYGPNLIAQTANTGTLTVNTRIDNTIEITTEWNVADPGNTVTITNITTEILN